MDSPLKFREEQLVHKAELSRKLQIYDFAN